MGSKKKSIEDFFDKKFVDKVLGDHQYNYYYDDCGANALEKAIKAERDYFLNCSDAKKDFSPEARERRFKMYLERARKGEL